MNFDFSRAHHFDRVLREISPNFSPDRSDAYAQGFKIQRPLPTKSIYTEDDSHLCLHEGEEQDIHQFIEGSKSLKEKIYDKLGKSKKGKARGLVKEATFRPSIAKKFNNENSFKANPPNISSRQKTTQRRLKTDLGNTWADWKLDLSATKPSKVNIGDLSFHERQGQALKKKKQAAEEWKKKKEENEMKGCTFKPKLTAYSGRAL